MFELQGEGENRTFCSYYNYEIFLIEFRLVHYYSAMRMEGWGWGGGGSNE